MSTRPLALIYTRVSRDDSMEGKSNQRQREACRALADARGWEVIDEPFDDISVSAYSGKERPAWTRVLQAMRDQRVDFVIAWHMDRITRTVRDLTTLAQLARDTGVAVVTASGDLDLSNESGKFLATVLSAAAEMEVERKGARQKLANQQRAAEGSPWSSGWRPFGFNRDMTQVPEEAELIREAADAVLNGASLKSIARTWRDLGVSTPRSSRGANGWTHNGVKSILINPRNAGLNTYRGEVVGRGNWEPIISEETHHQLRALLTDPKRLVRTTGSAGRTPANLLSGVARCGTCGSTVSAGSSNGQWVYKCKGDHLTTPRQAADSAVVDSLIMAALITLPGAVLDLPETEDPEGIAQQIEGLEGRQVKITSAFAEDSISEATWRSANDAINSEMEALRERLAEAGAGGNLRARHQLSLDRFKDLDLNGRREFLMRACEITLHPRNRKRNVPITRQVSVFVRSNRYRPGAMTAVLAEHPDARLAMKEGRSIWTESPPPRSREEQEAERREIFERRGWSLDPDDNTSEPETLDHQTEGATRGRSVQ